MEGVTHDHFHPLQVENTTCYQAVANKLEQKWLRISICFKEPDVMQTAQKKCRMIGFMVVMVGKTSGL